MSDRPYWQKLQSPQWQRRRLERLQKAEFVCECCQDSGSQLHVHHLRYVKGREPWEYADNELRVLCEACHERAHEDRVALIEALLTVVAGAGPDDLELAAVIAGWIDARNPPNELAVPEGVLGAVDAYEEEFAAARSAAKKLMARRLALYERGLKKAKSKGQQEQHSGL